MAGREYGENGPHFRSEQDGSPFGAVIDELDSGGIACQYQLFLPIVPDRQSEHAVETIQNIGTPLLVTVNDDFRI